jgi:hypothetical protein
MTKVFMDERNFSNAALRLCGEVCVVLGWRPGAFWEATPDEVACVVAALRQGRGERDHFGAGELAALRERFPDG